MVPIMEAEADEEIQEVFTEPEVQAAIGAPAVTKVAAGEVVQEISIWEEAVVAQEIMMMTMVMVAAAEVEIVEALVWEDEVAPDIQTDVADVAVTGNNFDKLLINI